MHILTIQGSAICCYEKFVDVSDSRTSTKVSWQHQQQTIDIMSAVISQSSGTLWLIWCDVTEFVSIYTSMYMWCDYYKKIVHMTADVNYSILFNKIASHVILLHIQLWGSDNHTIKPSLALESPVRAVYDTWTCIWFYAYFKCIWIIKWFFLKILFQEILMTLLECKSRVLTRFWNSWASLEFEEKKVHVLGLQRHNLEKYNILP